MFDMFKQQPLVQFLSLYDLTSRTVMLLALVGDFKQSRKGLENLKITLNAFKDDVRLCIVNTLTVYLERTAVLRNSSKLFIAFVTLYLSLRYIDAVIIQCLCS